MAGKRNFLSVSGAVEYVKEVFLFNIDDLGRIREATPARCRQHIAPAEQVIDRLTCDFEQKREEVLKRLFARLNGRVHHRRIPTLPEPAIARPDQRAERGNPQRERGRSHPAGGATETVPAAGVGPEPSGTYY